MFSRVQKGGTIFKPVARPKARQSNDNASNSRQPSVAPDSAVQDELLSVSVASGSMQPPSTIPSKPSPLADRRLQHSDTFSQLDASEKSISAEVSDASSYVAPLVSPDPTRPLSVQPPPLPHHTSSSYEVGLLHTQSAAVVSDMPNPVPTPLLMGQSRGAPVVVSTGSETLTTASEAAIPIILSSGAPSTHGDNAISYLSLDTLPGSSNEIPVVSLSVPIQPLGPESQPGVGQDDEPFINGNQPRLALTGESIVKVPKPRRKAASKQQNPHPSEVEVNGISDDTVSQKRTRRRRVVSTTAEGGEDLARSIEESAADVPKKVRRGKRKVAEHEPETGTQSPSKRRKRATGGRKGRKRAPSLAPFDADAEPGEELDPTVMTMSALCDDTGQGRVSSKAAQVQRNYSAWKASNKEKRARLKTLQEAKKYGRGEDEDNRTARNAPPIEEGTSRALNLAGPSSNSSTNPAVDTNVAQDLANHVEPSISRGNATGDGFDYSQALATSRYNVQVRIGPNGETIVDEESLFVDRNEGEDTENYTHVEESDTTKFVNSATYGKRFRGSRWSAEETQLFYDALSQFGENYEMISMILPGRDRKACKNKFKSEDKKNPERISYCLTHRVPYDMQTLSRMTGKDFSGPTPEIRAPTPLTLAETQELASGTDDQPVNARGDGEEEVVGTLDDFEEEALFGTTSNGSDNPSHGDPPPPNS